MPPEFWQVGLGLAAGAALGALYFGGLWLTVTRVPRTRRPYLLLGGSFVARTAAVLTGFYLLLPHGWMAQAVAMVGFLVARQLWLRVKGGVAGAGSVRGDE